MLEQLINRWLLLSHPMRFGLWVIAGVVLLIVFLYCWYRLIRHILGHRKFRGVWFDASGHARLIENILARQGESGGVVDHDELQLLRKHFSIKPLYKSRYGGYL